MHDKVRVLGWGTQFDIVGYVQSKLNATFLKIPIEKKLNNFSKKNLRSLILEFMKVNGYRKTLESLLKDSIDNDQQFRTEMDEENPKFEEIVKAKSTMRNALKSQNFLLSIHLLRKYKKYFSKENFCTAKILIKVLKILYFFRKKNYLEGIKFANKYLAKHRKRRLPILDTKYSKIRVEVKNQKKIF